MNSYSGDAIILHDAWAMALKLAKQNFRRSQKNKQKVGGSWQEALALQVNDVRLLSQLAGASSSDVPTATQGEILGQLDAMQAAGMTVEASDASDASEASEAQMEPAAIEASDSYSASSDSYSDSYSYSTYSEADSDVEKAEKDDKEILQVARDIAPIDVKRQLGFESEESDSQVKTPPPKKPTIKRSATKDIAPSAAKDAKRQQRSFQRQHPRTFQRNVTLPSRVRCRSDIGNS